MKVFVAGATGAIGRPLIAQLVAAGHDVTGMVRDDAGGRQVRDQGAKAELADALDREVVEAAVKRSQAEVVINQLTALPKQYRPETMQAAAAVDHRVRREGGANLQAAAQVAGARRYLLQSCAFWYEPGNGLADESAGFAVNASPYIAAGSQFYRELETAASEMRRPEVVFLRYGFLYGPGTWYTRDGDAAEQIRQRRTPIVGDGNGVWSWIHVEDAARAAVLALDRGSAGAYNIVDDNPSEMRVWLPAFARAMGGPEPPHITVEQAGSADADYFSNWLRGATNVKAKRELGFQPRRLEWLT